MRAKATKPKSKTDTKTSIKVKNRVQAKPLAKKKAATKALGAETRSTPVIDAQRSLEIEEYAKAMRVFTQGKYELAQPLFLRLTAAANVEIAHAARMRLLMCEQRLAVRL